MPEAWTAEELAAATGEPVERLAAFAEVGLLLRRADGRYEGDAWNRVALIRFTREHGVDENQLAGAVAAQGDLLGIFEGLSVGEATPDTLAGAAEQVGLADDVMAEVTQALGSDASAIATTEDVDALRLLAQAVSTGLDREPLLQLVRVYADLLDRLADAEVRIPRLCPRTVPRCRAVQNATCSTRPSHSANRCSAWSNPRCSTSIDAPGRG
jgi:adenylate cyclase